VCAFSARPARGNWASGRADLDRRHVGFPSHRAAAGDNVQLDDPVSHPEARRSTRRSANSVTPAPARWPGQAVARAQPCGPLAQTWRNGSGRGGMTSMSRRLDWVPAFAAMTIQDRAYRSGALGGLMTPLFQPQRESCGPCPRSSSRRRPGPSRRRSWHFCPDQCLQLLVPNLTPTGSRPQPAPALGALPRPRNRV
jgi:hypothetical protein